MQIPNLAASAGPPEGRSATRTNLRVRFAETDLMGIVHHGNYLLYLEEARVDYLRRRGAVYAEWVTRGIQLPVVDARLRYRATAGFADALDVESWVGDVARVTLRFDYRVYRGKTVVAEGYTTLACVDQRLVPRRIPSDILALIMGPETIFDR